MGASFLSAGPHSGSLPGQETYVHSIVNMVPSTDGNAHLLPGSEAGFSTRYGCLGPQDRRSGANLVGAAQLVRESIEGGFNHGLSAVNRDLDGP
jgi:hypothetical protein